MTHRLCGLVRIGLQSCMVLLELKSGQASAYLVATVCQLAKEASDVMM